MFGLKRRAQEKAEALAAEWAAVGRVVYDQMVAELAGVLAAAMDRPGMTDADCEALALKAHGVVAGLKAVLLEGLHFTDPAIAQQEHPMRCGAASAYGARNLAFLGQRHNPNVRGDMAFGLGLARDEV